MEELRQQLASIINQSQLPFEAIFYVVKDVYREVNDLYKNILEQQQNASIAEDTEEETAKDEAEQTE